MSADKRSVVAKVTVSFEVDVGSWSLEATFEQIEKQAKEVALQRLRRMAEQSIQKDSELQVNRHTNLSDVRLKDVIGIDIVATKR